MWGLVMTTSSSSSSDGSLWVSIALIRSTVGLFINKSEPKSAHWLSHLGLIIIIKYHILLIWAVSTWSDDADFEFVNTITAIEVLWDHWDPQVWSHWLGVEMVQQVVRVTVAVPAHHHQGDEGGQEDGGQHPNGHDHHRLHGYPVFHHGGGQLQSVCQETNQRRPICLILATVASSSVRRGRRWVAAVRLIGWQSNETSGTIKGDVFRYPCTNSSVLVLQMWHLQPEWKSDFYLRNPSGKRVFRACCCWTLLVY